MRLSENSRWPGATKCTQIIDEILLIAQCSRPEEWEGQTFYLPLP